MVNGFLKSPAFKGLSHPAPIKLALDFVPGAMCYAGALTGAAVFACALMQLIDRYL
jgi:hypothetical protein